jgi:hypothetical protein
MTYTITGKTANGTTFTSFTQTQSLSKSEAGAGGASVTGAGIVYRGDFDTGDTYSSTSLRKDVVKYSGAYKICNTDGATGAFVSGEWDVFGAEFTSVATDILFSQHVYADYTVNIGTENSTPVIALNSDSDNSHANPYIGIGGATAFANAQADIFIGYDSGNSSAPSISLGTTLKMVAGANAAATTLTLGAATAIGTGNGIYMDGSGDAFRVGDAGGTRMQWDGDNVEIYGGATKMVSLGNLNWIAGWTIAADKLSAGTDADYIALMPGTSGYAIQVGDSTFADAKFSVTEAGVIKAISGTVGGWTLSSTTLTSNDVEISNTGKIRMGSSLPNSATDGTGFYADGDRNFLVGSSAGNHLQYLAAGTVDIQSTQFNLNATTVIIDSSAADGKIQLGPSGGPGSATGTSNAGAYLDGTGKFNFGDGTGNYIRFKGDGLEVRGDITVTGGQLSGSISDFPSDENLFAYFPLHNEVISDAGNNRVLDMSGNGRHGDDDVGSISGGTTFVSGSTSGPTAGAAQFDGSDSRIDLNQVALDLTANMDLSLSFWIKKTNTTANIAPFGIHDGGVNDLIWIMDDGGVNNRTELYINEVTLGTLTVPTTYEFTNNWRHFVIVAEDGAQAKLYVDGELIGNYTTANVETANFGDCDEMLLGGELDGPGGAPTNDFTGYMSEFRVYNTVLTADNARALFNQPSGPLSGGTKITGDYISTGKLTSTNYSATAGSQIDLDAGTAVFGGSDGTGITFAANGDITSTEYLVERSRLFGGGEDGTVVLGTGTNQSTIASTFDSHDTTANLWLLVRDAYAENLTIDSGVTLKTNGYRLFVRNVLLNNGTIKNDGGDGSGRTTRGDPGTGNTLAAGVRGATGGEGGESGGSGGSPGGHGGASGGSGGHVMIFARTVTNNGTIRACGGIGAPGSPVGAPL